MLPFNVQFKTGLPVYEQVIYAVDKALVAGQLESGDPFPSVRKLSKELKISPNTAQKVVYTLKQDGLLEVVPGIGTVVSHNYSPSKKDCSKLLGEKIEILVVEAKKLNLSLVQVIKSIEKHWKEL